MFRLKVFVLGILCSLPFYSICQEIIRPGDNLQYVDPRIGNVGWLLVPTRPTVHLPNQMIRMYPERTDHLDDQIKYFPLSVAAHRIDNLFGIMPASGEVIFAENPISAWDSQLEITRPDYYFTWLEDYDIKVEFTPGKKAGLFRFSFPEGKIKHILLQNLSKSSWNALEGDAFVSTEFFQGIKAYVFAQIAPHLR